MARRLKMRKKEVREEEKYDDTYDLYKS